MERIARTVASFPVVERVMLFGLRVSGKLCRESGIDLLVVVRETPSKLKGYFE
ncbi:hypothetical protein QBE54_00950 [Thermatribacter velox]|uniref:Nucleotidyltransferase domain-containing protein n=1 Tax=Thermatribacter velox TaxID=3039681 RepID=A0ABZ2YBH7_9BACT